MASNAFGAVVQDAPADDPNTNGHAADATDAQELSLDDPRLTSESLEVNPEGDAYATQPPVPDGVYRAKLKQVDVKDAHGKPVRYAPKQDAKTGAVYAFTAVEAAIQGLNGKEQYDGIRLTDNFVDSMVRPRTQSSRVSTLITKAGGKVPARGTVKEYMELLLKTLAGEPEAGIETVWEAACMTCDEAAKAKGDRKQGTFLRGEHRFPQGKGGKGQPAHDPNVQCPTCKGWVLARPRIQRYLSLDELKQAEARQGGGAHNTVVR